MSGLETLVRLHQRKVDEKRAALSALERTRGELIDAERRLERSLAREQEKVSASSESGYTFPMFTQGVIVKREALRAAKAEIALLMRDAKAELVAAYQEFKKYDLTQLRRAARAEATAKRRDQMALDEIAVERFRRRPRD